MLKPASCNGCPLREMSYSFSRPEGTGSLGVVLVGEGLGDSEAVDGLPFRPKASAGSKLEETFQKLGVSRQQFLLWNMIGCQPPNNQLAHMPWEQGAIEHCKRAHFDRVVGGFRTTRHKTILGLGGVTLRYLAGYSGIAKEKQGISDLRGYVSKCEYGYIVCSYHPAFIRRGNTHLSPVLAADLAKAIKVASGEYTNFADHPDYKKPSYWLHPSIDQAKSFYYKCKDRPNATITYDIETPDLATLSEEEREKANAGDMEIVQIQFSYAKGSAIAIPWRQEYMPTIRAILALPNDKANHNTYAFDNPLLRAKGIHIAGAVHDTMWMFKHWHPALEKGLQKAASLVGFPFPWKHLYGEQLEFYGCADVDAVQYLVDGLPPLLKAQGLWNGYYRHVYELNIALQKASDRGLPINLEKHKGLHKRFKATLSRIHAEIQTLVPKSMLGMHPVKKEWSYGTDGKKIRDSGVPVRIGYVKPPKQVLQAVATYRALKERMLAQGKKPVCAAKFVYRKLSMVYRLFEEQCQETGDVVQVRRWVKLKEFNVGSPKQVLAYIRWKKSWLEKHNDPLADAYYIPTTIRERKESTGKELLDELVENTNDDVLSRVSEYRSMKKMITNDLPNWRPASDGAVHATWTYSPPTGQLASRRPNIQNASKHTLTGQEFREIIEALAGHVLVEFDYRSFHVATMGWLANDADYIRFSQLDPHSIFASWLETVDGPRVEFSWSDAEILARCKEVKQHYPIIRQEIAKKSVLGNQLGLGPRKLWLKNKRYITSQHMAEELQGILRDEFPKVHRRKGEMTHLADRQNYLINPFGRIQYFYDVYTYRWVKREGRWRQDHGADHEKVLAFAVQSPAHGKVAEDILACEAAGYNDRYRFVNTIHDSLVFMPSLKRLDNCIADVQAVLESPCKRLRNAATGPEGLRVAVEVSRGYNARKYDKAKNPKGMREL